MSARRAPDPAALMRSSAEAGDNGNVEEAIGHARRAARAARDSADLQNAIGAALVNLGAATAARRCFERAVELAPAEPRGYLNLAWVHLDHLGQAARAETLFRRAIGAAPDDPTGYLGLCAALVRQGPAEDVLRVVIDSGLFADPRNAYLSIADGLMLEGRYDEVRLCCHELVRAAPDTAKAFGYLAEADVASGDFESALRHYQHAARLAETAPDIVSGLLRALASVGRLEEARRVYLAADAVWSQMRRASHPSWRGEPLHGKTLFMRTSRGHGDAIQFARYVTLAKARGGAVVVQTSPALAPLVRTVPGIDRVILPHDDPGAIDYECDFELFGLLAGIDGEDPGQYVPYLSVPDVSSHIDVPGEASRSPRARLRVAITWEGRDLFARDPYRRRAIPLTALAALLEHPEIEVLAVQKGVGARQLHEYRGPARLVDVGRQCRHYGDTAAFLTRADLVISTDCSVAHVAGALGCPACILLPFAAGWRWRDRDGSSVWYPSARLLRQERPGDWSGPLRAVSSALDRLLASAPTSPRRELSNGVGTLPDVNVAAAADAPLGARHPAKSADPRSRELSKNPA
jgi:Flp pilus assembly protein TadD